MYEIIPGILEKDWNEIERKIELVRPFVKTIHIDILDGDFAPNVTFLNPIPFEKYASDIFFELHMMVEEPIQYVRKWVEYGFKRFLGHIEEMSSQQEFVKIAKKYGEAGLAVDGPSSIDQVKVSYEDLDSLLIYTSDKVGFSGPPFLESRLEKIKAIRQQSSIPIEVDGGINDQTINLAKQAGATRFVSTSFLFNAGNCIEQYKKLREAINF